MFQPTLLRRPLLALLIVALAVAVPAATSAQTDIPRMPDGRPDLSGTYDVATLTPTYRPSNLGDKLALSDEEAEAIAERARRTSEFMQRASNPDRDAPPAGGNVGGYNYSLARSWQRGCDQARRQVAHVDPHRIRPMDSCLPSPTRVRTCDRRAWIVGGGARILARNLQDRSRRLVDGS